MFARRSNEAELIDDLELRGEALSRNLSELKLVNTWLGGYRVLVSALKKTLHQYGNHNGRRLRIADLGSGGGDTLRYLAGWARKAGLDCQWIGIDANSFMVDYARSHSAGYPEISFKKDDVLGADFGKDNHFDIVCMSLFCHHFTDDQLVQLFSQLKSRVKGAILINDLHRHWLAYYSIWLLTRLLGGSHLIQHDAPLSVRRAFKKDELIRLLTHAGFTKIEVKWCWAFRFRVVCTT